MKSDCLFCKAKIIILQGYFSKTYACANCKADNTFALSDQWTTNYNTADIEDRAAIIYKASENRTELLVIDDSYTFNGRIYLDKLRKLLNFK